VEKPNKQRVLFLLRDGYWLTHTPSYTSHIAKEINKRGIPIDFFVEYSAYEKAETEVDRQEGMNRIFYYDMSKWLYRYKKRTTNKTPLLCRVKDKLIRTIFFESFRYGNSYIDVKKLIKKIKTVNPEGYSHIYSCINPFCRTRLSYYVKKEFPAAKRTVYMIDNHVYNPIRIKRSGIWIFKVIGIWKRKRQFKKYIQGTDKLMMLPGIFQKNKEKNYKTGFEDITEVYPLPNLVDPKIGISSYEDNLVHLVFAGSFFKNMRNPDKVLEIFGKLGIKDLSFDIFGSASFYVQRHYKNIDERIKLCGTVSQEDVKDAMSKSNFVVNIGCTETSQISGKVFELIASGRPIINFFYDDTEPTLEYLEKYPSVISINVNTYTQQDVVALEKFIIENKDRRFSFAEATKDLQEYLGENIVKRIVDSML